MRSLRSLALIVAAAVTTATLSAAVLAQEKPFNGIRPADLRAHAIVDARVVTAPGRVLDRAVVVIRDGIIEAVGVDVRVPADARVWPGAGLTVYPGLIDAAVLVDAGTLPDAPGRHWNALVQPELRVADRRLPDAALRKTLRKLGFTTAAVYPEKGILRGSGAVVALAEAAEHARTYREQAAMGAGFDRAGNWSSPATPGSLMGSIAVMRQTLLDAQWHAERRRVYRDHARDHAEGNEPPAPADSLVALDAVLAGRQALLFESNDEHDALRAARLAAEFDLDLVLIGSGTEFRRSAEIAALGATVITPLDFPERPDVSTLSRADGTSLRDLMTWEQAPTNPRRLVAADVTVALTTHGLRSRRDFPKRLHKAIQHGLTEDDALAALTTVPAELLGLDAVMGTIEPGKIANLVVVEGSLFDQKPEIRETWINGRRHEIEAAPERTVAFTGTLRTDDGQAIGVELDTEKPSATFHRADEKIRVKKIAVVKDRLTLVVDAKVFDRVGYVRLGGVITGETVTGVGAMPDGSRFGFTITPDADVALVAEDADEADADDPISGDWQFRVAGGRGTIEFDVSLTRESDGTIGGSASVMDRELDLTSASFDEDTGKLVLEMASARGATRTFEGTVTGDTITGTSTSRRGEATFEGRRFEGGGDDDFEMPPDTLLTPLGAYGRAAPPPVEDVLVTNATIWTSGPDGIIANGTLLVRDGRIAHVGASVPAVDASVRRIDAGGRHITPGLLDCHSHTGVSGGVNEFPEANTAEVRIGDVINPDDVNWYRQLAGGLTAANQLHGSANPIGGQNSVVKLKWGGRADDFPIDDAIPGIKFALGENVKRRQDRYPNTRMGVETFIRDGFTAAREYEAAWARYRALPTEVREATMPPRRDLELDTLVEILNGERLIHCHSYRQDEILALIRVADDFGFTIGTFQHVLEGYKVADAIAAHGAGGSSFSDWWAYKVEVMDAIPHNGALMTNVGVTVSFNSDSSELARRMNTEAAKAVRYGGLSPHEALKLVTINPAQQLRIDHRTGSLEVGKDADFVIWSADPLSTYARCEQTWIEGACYFDLESDLAMRETVQAERERLVQKILAQSHGEPAGGEDTAGETPPPRPAAEFAGLSNEARAWLHERARYGEDPFADHPGDCGCEGLWRFMNH